MDIAFDSLATKFLAWCEKHRSPRTVEWYKGHLHNFIEYLKDESSIPAVNLKPFHVAEWVDSKATWGPTFKGGAIISVKRVYNWAEEMGYIETSPIKKLKKPTAQRRDNHMTPEYYGLFLAEMCQTDPFRDLFVFVWNTGCRPQEVRHIESRHIDLGRERIVFPKEESKGKRYARVIHIAGPALEIIKRRLIEFPEGKVFRNARRGKWHKYAICNRMDRLSDLVGKPFALYDLRHGFATRKLIQGHDSLTVAALMGHVDGSMLARVYSHIDQDDAHMKSALVD